MKIVFKFIPADFAVVSTGATINATTAGLMPLNILLIISLFYMVSGVRNIAIAKIIKNEGKIVPKAAVMLPLEPFNRSPVTTDMLTASMPGIDCAMARRSRNSACSIHLCFSTISRWIIEIIAHPPPKVNAPILKNVANNFR